MYLKFTDPVRQAVFITAVSLGIMTVSWGISALNIIAVEALFAWTIAAAFTLLFAIFNSLMSIQAESVLKYWGRSIYSYLALAFTNGMAARFFSGVPIGEAESYKWIFVVVSIGFLVFLSLVNFMKRIVQFAEREDWSQPRIKPPKKR